MTSTTAILDVAAVNSIRSQLDRPPAVDMTSGVRAAVALHRGNRWLNGFLRATRGPGRITWQEYFYYRLYDPSLSLDALRRYVGKRVQHRMHMACNDVRWHAAADDKLLNYTILRGEGLPIPDTFCIYSQKRRARTCLTINSREALTAFLADRAHYPMFCKPIDGIYSVGAMKLEDVDDGFVTLNHGQRARLEDVVAFIEGASGEGYLFQRLLEPDPALIPITGPVVPSVRVLLFGDRGVFRIESAVVKLPRAANIADNFWLEGNMLGALDADTGMVGRLITGTGEATAEVDIHPDTNRSLAGLAVPRWPELSALVGEAASCFPAIRTQSWDVALSDSGPVLMDLNFGGDLNLHQIAHQRGILSDSYCHHLRRCGYKGALP